MKPKYAQQIRAGVHLARMSSKDKAWSFMLARSTSLTLRAYLREEMRAFERAIHRNARCWREIR